MKNPSSLVRISFHREQWAGWCMKIFIYFWAAMDVISGKDNSSRTCSWSSTTYTPVQLTAIITSFFGRFGPDYLQGSFAISHLLIIITTHHINDRIITKLTLKMMKIPMEIVCIHLFFKISFQTLIQFELFSLTDSYLW